MFLVVFLHQNGKCHFGFFVDRLNVRASVVVVGDLTVSLQHELLNPTAVNAVVLARLIIMLYPVMKNAVFNLDASFCLHGFALLISA